MKIPFKYTYIAIILYFLMPFRVAAQINPPPPTPTPAIEDMINSLRDWPNLGKYNHDNRTIKNRPYAVFLGDSITEFWNISNPAFFNVNNYLNRGVSGQTTAQMLLRLHQDVITLRPKLLVLLAGTNDIAQVSGINGITANIPIESTKDNIATICETASAKDITPIIVSVLPVSSSDSRRPIHKIIELNRWIQRYASHKKYLYIDAFSKFAGENNYIKQELTSDGVHLTDKGYQFLERIIQDEIYNLKLYGNKRQ